MFGFLTSTKRPAPGAPVRPALQGIERPKAWERPADPWGVIDKYRFETGEIKQPVQGTVTACGWTCNVAAYRGMGAIVTFSTIRGCHVAWPFFLVDNIAAWLGSRSW